MTARPLHAVLRALADTGPAESDAALLRRFVATRDDEAFATLVKRHGRLVWAVCRHLTRSDAEADDAFQATFLVLVKNAAGVKDAAKLSAWLHGVAFKVCGKSRLSAKRRTTREQAAAAREGHGQAVPDSAWDRALAAVHEEVSGLPDTLRVPFVLCCLEGVGQTEAAEQLGWKLGTLSGRLTRAKNAVLDRLSARGLTLGVLASVGLGSVPADVSAKAVGLGQIGFAVPGSVLQLSTGVIGMSVHKVKLLAAGVLATCGLAVSGGAGWVATAEAQSGALPAKVASPADRVKQLEAELTRAKADAAKAEAEAAQAAAEVAKAVAVKKAAEAKKKYDDELAKTPNSAEAPKEKLVKKPDYDFDDVKPLDAAGLTDYLKDREKQGWEFVGEVTVVSAGKPKPTWVFRKAKGGVAYTGESGQYRYFPAPNTYALPPLSPAQSTRPAYPTPPAPPAAPPAPASPVAPLPPLSTSPAPTFVLPATEVNDVEAIEAEIKRLQGKLDALKKAKPKGK